MVSVEVSPMSKQTSLLSGFLSAEDTDEGWSFLYEPMGDDFGGLPNEKPTVSSGKLHAMLTKPRGTGKETSSSRGEPPPDIPREPLSENNDRARAGKFIEPGVYRIAVTRGEVDEYVRIVSGRSAMLGHVVAQTKPQTIAQDVAISKMIQLARYMDPDHEVDEYPRGVVLEMSNMEAVQRMTSEIRQGREDAKNRMFAEAMGREDWLEHVKANEGHPLGTDRSLPEPVRKEYVGTDIRGRSAWGFSSSF